MKSVLIQELLGRTLSVLIITNSAILQVTTFTFRRVKETEVLSTVYAGTQNIDGMRRGMSRYQKVAACSPIAKTFGLTEAADRA